MILTLTIILGILVVIFGYTTFNLLRKNENAEELADINKNVSFDVRTMIADICSMLVRAIEFNLKASLFKSI